MGKILMQTMDSNPAVLAGEVKPYSGIMDCFKRVSSEQGVKAFWRGNLVNCMRYAPQQGSALAFNDFFKSIFPKADKDKQFMKYMFNNLMAGGLGGATAMVICYPLDFARTRLASDLQAGKGKFNGIMDCLSQTVKQQGFRGLYRGTAVSIAGAFVYRAGQLGLYGTVMGLNPYKKDTGLKGFFSAVIIAPPPVQSSFHSTTHSTPFDEDSCLSPRNLLLSEPTNPVLTAVSRSSRRKVSRVCTRDCSLKFSEASVELWLSYATSD